MSNEKQRKLNQRQQVALFSIEGSGGGFTDQILKFNAFYRLGRHLGYTYVHNNFRVYRQDIFSSWIISSILQNKFLYGIYRRLFGFDVYAFLGFNSYLRSLSHAKRAAKSRHIIVGLNDEIVQSYGISSLAELTKYVHDEVDAASEPDTPILVILRLDGSHWKFFKLIFDVLIEYPDNINIYNAYLNERTRYPWRSLYEPGKYRVLVHMRQGDTALIRTPWGSHIPVLGIRHSPKELTDIKEASGIFITTTDYNQFISELTDHLGSEKFTFVFTSDGYKRGFQKLLSNIHGFRFTPEQIRALKSSARNYDANDFSILRRIPNSTLVIGETTNNLKDLIHSTLTADIIVAGSQQFMMKKFVSTYYATGYQPIFINLYKGNMLNAQQLFPLERVMKIVNVNLLDYNIEKVASAIIDYLPAQRV